MNNKEINQWETLFNHWKRVPAFRKNIIVTTWKFSHFLFSFNLDGKLKNYLAGRVSKSLIKILSPNTLVKIIHISLYILFSIVLYKSLALGVITLVALFIIHKFGKEIHDVYRYIEQDKAFKLWVKEDDVVQNKFRIIDKVDECITKLKIEDSTYDYPLPKETFGCVLSYCDGTTLTQVTMTSKHFFSIIFKEKKCKDEVIRFKTENFLNDRNRKMSEEDRFDEATLSILKEVMIKHLQSKGLAYSIYMFIENAKRVCDVHENATSDRTKFLYHFSDKLADWTETLLNPPRRMKAVREDLNLAKLVKDLIDESKPSAATLDMFGLTAKIVGLEQVIKPQVAARVMNA